MIRFIINKEKTFNKKLFYLIFCQYIKYRQRKVYFTYFFISLYPIIVSTESDQHYETCFHFKASLTKDFLKNMFQIFYSNFHPFKKERLTKNLYYLFKIDFLYFKN